MTTDTPTIIVLPNIAVAAVVVPLWAVFRERWQRQHERDLRDFDEVRASMR